jgi:hypothetical protein
MSESGNKQPGDMFVMVGYDIVATACCDVGQVLVLNNNSSHFLVVESDTGGEDFGADGMHKVYRNVNVRLHESFAYGGINDDCEIAHTKALRSMVDHAIKWSPSLAEAERELEREYPDHDPDEWEIDARIAEEERRSRG